MFFFLFFSTLSSYLHSSRDGTGGNPKDYQARPPHGGAVLPAAAALPGAEAQPAPAAALPGAEAQPAPAVAHIQNLRKIFCIIIMGISRN